MRLHDNSISHIAKIVQLAILTGTDIVDNLRAIEFQTVDTELLDINPEYLTTFEENLNKLLQTALTEGLDLSPTEE
jgi:hypothetical protein